jgi:N-acetyltransferase
MRKSRLYIFLVPYQTRTNHSREKIVGCIVAQHIETAMAIATSSLDKSPSSETSASAASLVVVDTGMGIFCHPEFLSTPMGIPRLFVASTHRRQGVATKLLTAAARTFIHGYELDPRKGEIAFTQPTGDGKAVMFKWGCGGVRIYEE